MNWFRICMEAPEESGGGGEEEVVEAPEFHSAFSKAGWQGDVAEDTPETEEEPVEEGEEEEEETPAEEAARLYAGKYKTPEDLEKGYQELVKKLGAPAAPEPEPEPTMPTWTADQFSALGEIPSDGLSSLQREQLGNLMQADPKAAAAWAAQNAHLLTEEEFGAVQSNWYTADPWGARQAWAAAEEAERQARLQEEYGPRMDAVDAVQANNGMQMALDAVPDMAEHRQDFARWIEQNPQIDDHLTALTDPVQIRDNLVTIFYNWYAPQLLTRIKTQEAEAQQAAAEAAAQAEQEEAEAQQQQRRGRTMTKTAPATPAGSEASADDIRAFIRSARN